MASKRTLSGVLKTTYFSIWNIQGYLQFSQRNVSFLIDAAADVLFLNFYQLPISSLLSWNLLSYDTLNQFVSLFEINLFG